MSYTNYSRVKSGEKTFDTQATRYGTNAQTGTECFSGFKVSKINRAYHNACVLIDDLIVAVKEKRNLSHNAIKETGNINDIKLGSYQLEEQYQSPISYKPKEQKMSHVKKEEENLANINKFELLKIIQEEKWKNQNLSRLCSRLENENIYLKESYVQTRHCHSRFKSGDEKTQRTEMTGLSYSRHQGHSRIFSDLQSLHEENQILRHDVIRLLEQ